MNRLVVVATRLERIVYWKLGKAIAASIATMPTTTISSIKVKPRSARRWYATGMG